MMPRLFAAALIVAVGCNRPAPSESARLATASRLSGVWKVRFSKADGGASATLDGRIAFVENHMIHRRFSGIGVPSNLAVADLPLSAWGFDPDEIPQTVVAGGIGGDSIAIHFGDDPPQLALIGAIDHDSITGTWWLSRARGIGATGAFVMRRCVSC